MRKLIIFLLFIIFTVVAVGFISINTFTFATNLSPIGNDSDMTELLVKAKEITAIELPNILQEMVNIKGVAFLHTEDAGYLCILSSEVTYDFSSVAIPMRSIIMWIFMLLLIILLPKRRSKRKIRRIAEDVVEDEMENYRPARKSYDRGRSKRRRYDDDEEDYED